MKIKVNSEEQSWRQWTHLLLLCNLPWPGPNHIILHLLWLNLMEQATQVHLLTLITKLTISILGAAYTIVHSVLSMFQQDEICKQYSSYLSHIDLHLSENEENHSTPITCYTCLSFTPQKDLALSKTWCYVEKWFHKLSIWYLVHPLQSVIWNISKFQFRLHWHLQELPRLEYLII